MTALGAGVLARPSGEFAPAGDLLFVPPKSRQKAPPDRAALRFASGSLRCSGLEGSRGTRFATLRSNNRAKSVVEACCARALKALRCSAALKGVRRNTSNARPVRLATRLFGCSTVGCSESPLQNRREAQKPGARAQHASTTYSAPLSDRSERSERREFGAGPGLRASQGTPKRSAGAVLQGSLFAYFLAGQKVGRPPGRIPGMGLTQQAQATKRQARQAPTA